MHGGEHVRDRVSRREAEIREQQKAIEARKLEEVRLQQALEEEQTKRLGQEERYNSLAEEAESKSRKLKQLWSKFRAAQSEIDDLQIEQQQEKQDLLHTVRELTRQVQLQNMVIESFVPAEEVAKLERRAVWDEGGSEQWRLFPLSESRKEEDTARPKSHPSLLRPTSFLAREVAADLTNNEPRFRGINVLSFDLDMPERTTADYEVGVQPNVRAALTAALKDDEQLEVDAEENLPSMGGMGGGRLECRRPPRGLARVCRRSGWRGRGPAARSVRGRPARRRTGSQRMADGGRRRTTSTRCWEGERTDGAALAEEEMPESRGLMGQRRRR